MEAVNSLLGAEKRAREVAVYLSQGRMMGMMYCDRDGPN